MKQISLFLLTITFTLLIFTTILPAEQTDPNPPWKRKRWELEFTNQTPELFTYVDSTGDKKNYWYLVYTILNRTEKPIRLAIDICIKTDTNKYYQDIWHPLIEDQMISNEEKLGGLPLGVQKIRIKELKEELKYLNCKEIRDKKEIKPGETIKGIAVFKELDPRANELEVMVGGLIDIIKVSFTEPPEIKPVYEYEPKILKLAFSQAGDEFFKHDKPVTDPVDPRKFIRKREWLTRPYGPICDKETLPNLIKSLEEENPLIRNISWFLLRRITPVDPFQDTNFAYDPSLAIQENQKVITRWREWWERNNDRLTYNLSSNKFEIRSESE
ncbi:MAG: hypothetical protein AAB019_07560 [Planctomycetota bacterium]